MKTILFMAAVLALGNSAHADLGITERPAAQIKSWHNDGLYKICTTNKSMVNDPNSFAQIFVKTVHQLNKPIKIAPWLETTVGHKNSKTLSTFRLVSASDETGALADNPDVQVYDLWSGHVLSPKQRYAASNLIYLGVGTVRPTAERSCVEVSVGRINQKARYLFSSKDIQRTRAFAAEVDRESKRSGKRITEMETYQSPVGNSAK